MHKFQFRYFSPPFLLVIKFSRRDAQHCGTTYPACVLEARRLSPEMSEISGTSWCSPRSSRYDIKCPVENNREANTDRAFVPEENFREISDIENNRQPLSLANTVSVASLSPSPSWKSALVDRNRQRPTVSRQQKQCRA